MCTRTTTEKPEKQMDLGQQASIGNSTAGEHTVTHSVCGLCSSLSMLGIVLLTTMSVALIIILLCI